jgi:hypothetical protein
MTKFFPFFTISRFASCNAMVIGSIVKATKFAHEYGDSSHIIISY